MRKNQKTITAVELAGRPDIDRRYKDRVSQKAQAQKEKSFGLLGAPLAKPARRQGYEAHRLEDLAEQMGWTIKSVHREVKRKGLQTEAVGGRIWAFFPSE